MTDGLRVRHVRRHVKAAGLAAMLAGTAHLAGCSAMSSLGMGDVASTAAVPDTALDSDGQSSMSELAKATEYWRKQYAKNPADAAAALNYAKNLKAMGAAGHLCRGAHGKRRTRRGFPGRYSSGGSGCGIFGAVCPAGGTRSKTFPVQ